MYYTNIWNLGQNKWIQQHRFNIRKGQTITGNFHIYSDVNHEHLLIKYYERGLKSNKTAYKYYLASIQYSSQQY